MPLTRRSRRDAAFSLFFATDLHGSLVCFRKFLAAFDFYGVDVAILGGDMTGKMVVPVVRQPGGRYTANLSGTEVQTDDAGLLELETRIADAGYYPYRTDPDEMAELHGDEGRVAELFNALMIETIRRWGRLAEERYAGTDRVIYVAPGNDDPFEIDAALLDEQRFRVVEDMVAPVGGGHEMLSTGYSNRTPWDTHREMDEGDLRTRIATMASNIESIESAIFNIHVPPYNTGLDTGPDIDPHTWEQKATMGQGHTKPVGSVAVREAIEEYQPLLSLHGHIHESRGTFRLGRTLCINPGSDYGDGVLRGCLVHLDGKEVRGFQLTSG